MNDSTLLVRIPKRFFDDHRDRDLPIPAVVKFTQKHYWINSADPAIEELLDDARFYADPDGPDLQPEGLANAARALLRAIG